MSHTASESLPPLTATRSRSSGANMSTSRRSPWPSAAAQLDEVLGTEVGVVARQVDDRRCLARPDSVLAVERSCTRSSGAAPPEMTGRTSITSSSPSRASPGTSVPLRMTRCASRLSPRSSSSRLTDATAGHLDLALRVAHSAPSRDLLRAVSRPFRLRRLGGSRGEFCSLAVLPPGDVLRLGCGATDAADIGTRRASSTALVMPAASPASSTSAAR